MLICSERHWDQVSAERRELPWVKIEKNYVFDTPNGKQTLDDLFDGRSQLIVLVSATKDELAKGRMYYNYEMVEFQCEEQPGISVFYKDKIGNIARANTTSCPAARAVFLAKSENHVHNFLIAGGLSLRRTRSASDLLERTIFRHRRSVIPFAAKEKANTPTNIKTTNAIHISNHELRQKTGNSSTIVNSAEMVANKPMIAVKTIDFCNTWRSFKQSTLIRVQDSESCVAGTWNATASATLG